VCLKDPYLFNIISLRSLISRWVQALPGGHLEMFESWQECAIREVKEESDLDLGEVSFGHVTNDIMESENKHYVTIFMLAKCKAPNQQPKTMEPSKCEGWNSYSWRDLEKEQSQGSLFGPLDRLVKDRPSKVMDFLGLSSNSKTVATN